MNTAELKKLAEAASLTGAQLVNMSVFEFAEAQRLKQKFRQIRPEAILKLLDINAELVEALKALLRRDERNTCTHEETYRGGAIWEICRACGARWADDEGGKPEWDDPLEWINSYAALAKAEGGEL